MQISINGQVLNFTMLNLPVPVVTARRALSGGEGIPLFGRSNRW